jgi:hypothetical protein
LLDKIVKNTIFCILNSVSKIKNDRKEELLAKIAEVISLSILGLQFIGGNLLGCNIFQGNKKVS